MSAVGRIVLLLGLWTLPLGMVWGEVIRVASKPFTESYILGEMIAQIAESVGEAQVERNLGLGQTDFAMAAIESGQADVYPDYTDTLALVVLENENIKNITDLKHALADRGVDLSGGLGFNNTYALAVQKDVALANDLKTIGDLARVPDITAAFSEGFLDRKDTKDLFPTYGVHLTNVRTMAHALKYEALASKRIELTDLYTTDAKLSKFDVVLLDDVKGFFPEYRAVLVFRDDFKARFPKTHQKIQTLMVGQISREQIISLNALVDLKRMKPGDSARSFLKLKLNPESDPPTQSGNQRFKELWRHSEDHVFLVMVSLFVSIVLGLGLSVITLWVDRLSQGILVFVALLQTIPSLALFCFLIAPFGIGTLPAIIALSLYGLLPIVRNATTGLKGIDSQLLEVADSLGLSRWRRLIKVQFPLAMPMILSGIKTAAIIDVGTATLAALIGAGGYGVPIVQGLALHDYDLIFLGAIPAALMALGVHVLFEGMDRFLVPESLRANARRS